MVSCEMDARPGGRYRYVHRAPDGTEHSFRGEILEVQPPERIVQTFEYEGMPGHVNVETLTLEERDGRTILTVIARSETREERDGYLNSGMEAGARESYDRLDEYLASGVLAAASEG